MMIIARVVSNHFSPAKHEQCQEQAFRSRVNESDHLELGGRRRRSAICW
jgi:hypothetical protein